jgi:signal transduction histidine kinase
MERATGSVVGQALPSGLRLAVRPQAGRVRNVDGVGSVLRVFTARETRAAHVSLLLSLVVGAFFAAGTVPWLIATCATAWIVGAGVAVRGGMLRLSARMAAFDRRRLAWFGAPVEQVPLPRREPRMSLWQSQQAWARASWLWRLPAYQLVRLPAASAAGFVAVTWWWAAIICFVLAAGRTSPSLLLAWQVGPVSPGPVGVLALVLTGVAAMLAWPFIVLGMARADVLLARWLLGPSRSRLLAAEVTRLGAARHLAVESAEAERRRIERDLHDGLQPQLVSLALDLGLARARLERDPEAARSMVERAHVGAKRATEDLRNLVRGIHPAVLDERGLDAALSALVAGCAVPVSVDVNLGQRPDPVIESAAYFVIAEAITNVTKHSEARTAAVTVTGNGAMLRVVVEDDGRGGAHLEPGGGLAGLAARLASVDGILTVSSPPDGPTRIEAVIPCGQ